MPEAILPTVEIEMCTHGTCQNSTESILRKLAGMCGRTVEKLIAGPCVMRGMPVELERDFACRYICKRGSATCDIRIGDGDIHRAQVSDVDQLLFQVNLARDRAEPRFLASGRVQ